MDDYMEQPYIVYIKPDDAQRITAVNSSAFLTDLTGWVEIDRGFGDRYHHAQGNYFPDTIMDRAAWQAIVHGVTIVRHNLVTKSPSQ